MWIIDDLINQGLYDMRKREIWEREDTAVQRRAKDLEAAGLSKTLAAGSAATTNVTSSPEFHGGALDAMLASAQTMQGIKNAREENANMRKSREVMNADIALKFGQMKKAMSEADYFTAAGNNQMIDGQLKSEQMRLFAQQILESQERTKTYEHSAHSSAALANKYYFDALRQAAEIDLINTTGMNSSVGGMFNPFIRATAGVANRAIDKVKGSNSSTYYQNMASGFKWSWKKH